MAAVTDADAPIARSLSSLETVMGQLHLAILIARLVSVAKLRAFSDRIDAGGAPHAPGTMPDRTAN